MPATALARVQALRLCTCLRWSMVRYCRQDVRADGGRGRRPAGMGRGSDSRAATVLRSANCPPCFRYIRDKRSRGWNTHIPTPACRISACGTMMVYTEVRFAAVMPLVTQAVSATMEKVFAQIATVSVVVRISGCQHPSGEYHRASRLAAISASALRRISANSASILSHASRHNFADGSAMSMAFI